jgi:hypothetical protein
LSLVGLGCEPGVLFVMLALWLLFIWVLAGAVSVDASGSLVPWAGLSALVGLTLIAAPGSWLLGAIGAAFGLISAGYGIFLFTQSSVDFYFLLTVLVGLAIFGAWASARGRRGT